MKEITKLSFTVDLFIFLFFFLLEYSFTISTEYLCRPGHFLCTVFLLSMCTCSHAHPSHPILVSFFPPRIPEGQAEAGSLAAGRLRSLEDQLTIAKQKIHSFQKLTGDGKRVGAIWKVAGERIWHRARKYERIDSGGVWVDYIWYKTKSEALVSFRLQRESQSRPALNLRQLNSDDGRAAVSDGQGLCVYLPL